MHRQISNSIRLGWEEVARVRLGWYYYHCYAETNRTVVAYDASGNTDVRACLHACARASKIIGPSPAVICADKRGKQQPLLRNIVSNGKKRVIATRSTQSGRRCGNARRLSRVAPPANMFATNDTCASRRSASHRVARSSLRCG